MLNPIKAEYFEPVETIVQHEPDPAKAPYIEE
jgi:hypothetical protein